jgi:hypothetical protein
MKRVSDKFNLSLKLDRGVYQSLGYSACSVATLNKLIACSVRNGEQSEATLLQELPT